MTAHVFGASSPSCSNFALWKTASDNIHEYASDVTRTLEINFYVDDMLLQHSSAAEASEASCFFSFQTVTKAKDVIRKVIELSAKEGVNLTQFTSNNEDVLKSIPDENRRKNISDEALTFGKLPED